MITKDNICNVLEAIGFDYENSSGLYIRKYESCMVSVDFNNQKIIYPETQGLKVNDKTTSNFEHPENFVVLECVCRLLKKGYRPEHIELEPRWTLGHDAKGGKADILVKDDEGKSLIIIECKTAGVEFNKEKRNTEEDGGQLFSYWQQENSTRWLALYTSDWNADDLIYKCLVVSCEDDANIAKMALKDKDVKTYLDARNDKERFEVWDETYRKTWLDDVVFNEESQAYKIGIPPLRKGKLKDFTPDDHIVNSFEEILRHNNVSDKENAFNRLIALFICKLVDEIKKQESDIVDFQYKQGQDTYESLQDRLQHLHQQGMEEFMKEKMIYVPADYADNLFRQYKGNHRKAAIEDLKQTLRILKFYTNNDFAFKDVHNEELFYQNGKILVEVVQLFQPYRIVYPSKHQFLGDLFEQLLNKGFKQNEGQFFTPTPITRFIWDSLPLQKYINEHDLPRIIDYACGAGHFLTEGVEAINAVYPDSNNSWVEKHVFGVEKDYRLARVSKISMFMNGAGGCNIIFGDGLENYPEKGIVPASFDILVANPPYAVNGFKPHLKLKNNYFSILDKITPSSKEIDTLFVERISQLLKAKGIAAVVLPESILSSTLECYISAREVLLKNFYIRAIVNLGNNVFGATPTKTVILFLEKYDEKPCISELTKDTVNAILSFGGDADWEDIQVLDAYIEHQKSVKTTYLAFLRKELTIKEILTDFYLRTYAETFKSDGIKYPKKCSEEEKKRILQDKFYSWALKIEGEKLYHFALVYQQLTLVITAPVDNKERKDFYGYEWSNKKRYEGIVIKQLGGKLYNHGNRFCRGTLACAVRDSFAGVFSGNDYENAKYIKFFSLRNLIDFNNVNFTKCIATTANEDIEIKSRYPMQRIADFSHLVRGVTYTKENQVTNETANAILTADNITLDGRLEITKIIYVNDDINFDESKKLKRDDVFICLSSGSKKHVGKVAYISQDFPYYIGGFMGILRTYSKDVLPKYLALYLNSEQMRIIFQSRSTGTNIQNLSSSILNYEIPIPPLKIQQQILHECDKIDNDYNTNQVNIQDFRKKIDEIFSRIEDVPSQLGKVEIKILCDYITDRTTDANLDTYITTDNMLQDYEGIRPYEGTNSIPSSIAYQKGDILVSNIRPYLKKIWQADRDGSCSPDVLVLRPNSDKVDSRFLYYSLRRDAFFDYIMNEAGTRGLKMPRGNKDGIIKYRIALPALTDQSEIAEEISRYDALIAESKAIMRSCDKRKQNILESYLSPK